MMYYHGGPSGRGVEGQYGVALAANTRLQFAEIGDLQPDAETIVTYMEKPSWVRVGQSVYKTHCTSCHGNDGEGKIGPNLTDDVYKNVRQVDDIAKVIMKGANAGAMPAWSNRLHPNEVVLVSAYVAGLRGQELDSPRPPEGNAIPPWPEPPAQDEVEP